MEIKEIENGLEINGKQITYSELYQLEFYRKYLNELDYIVDNYQDEYDLTDEECKQIANDVVEDLENDDWLAEQIGMTENEIIKERIRKLK